MRHFPFSNNAHLFSVSLDIAMNTFHRPPLWLLTLLIMFPQLVETIYSPALTDISVRFAVSAQQAAQTLRLFCCLRRRRGDVGMAERLHRATPGDDGWTPVLRHGFPHGRCCH